MSKKKRLAGDHTTLIDLVARLPEYLCRQDKTIRISPGEISRTNTSGMGRKCVKITREIGWIRLLVTQGSTNQIVRVYGEVLQDVMVTIARWVRKNDIQLRFGKHYKSRPDGSS